MAWTTFPDVYQKATPLLPAWAATLTDPDAASALFWPTIAEYGLGFNLLILQKVGPTQLAALKGNFNRSGPPPSTPRRPPGRSTSSTSASSRAWSPTSCGGPSASPRRR